MEEILKINEELVTEPNGLLEVKEQDAVTDAHEVEVPEIIAPVSTGKAKARLLGVQRFVSKEELALVPTPEASGIWRPVSHMEAIETVERQIADKGWKIVNEQFGLVNDSKRMFGVMTIENTGNPDWQRCIGIRNSHDKSVRLGICAGLSVMVCTNLCFGGNKTVQRKHTTHIDVENVVSQAISTLDDSYKILEERMQQLKGLRINDDQARSLLVQLAASGAIPSCDILACFNEYKQPRHPEFESETHWDLFNAVTEISHKYSPARSERTHMLLTRAYGLDGERPDLDF